MPRLTSFRIAVIKFSEISSHRRRIATIVFQQRLSVSVSVSVSVNVSIIDRREKQRGRHIVAQAKGGAERKAEGPVASCRASMSVKSSSRETSDKLCKCRSWKIETICDLPVQEPKPDTSAYATLSRLMLLPESNEVVS